MSDAPGSSETIMITVAERKSRFGAITILKRRETGSLLYVQGDSFQSEADENGISLVGYIHAIFGLVQQADAKRVLMIGCGGGTLATMLARIGCTLTVVDIDPHAFLLARRYFRFPENIACRVADGCQYLLSEQGSFDAVVVDAFRGGFMKGLAMGAPYPVCAQLGSVAATYALEHLGGTAHAYTWDEFAARYERHFGKLQASS